MDLAHAEDSVDELITARESCKREFTGNCYSVVAQKKLSCANNVITGSY